MEATQVIAAVAVVIGTWLLLRTAFRKNPLDVVPGPRPAPGLNGWLKGNWPAFIHPRSWNYHKEVAETYGGVLTFKGFLGETQLYVYDVKAMQHIIVKEQDVYEETDAFIVNNQMTFGPGLLSTLGETHRRQRKMLNPVFSIAHMREMVPIFYDVVHKLGNSLQAQVEKGPTTIDILGWMSRTALELVGQSGLGYSFDPLTVNCKEHRFSTSVKLLVPAGQKLNFWRFQVLPKIAHLGPARFQRAVVNFLSLFWKDLRRMRDIVDVMQQTSEEILESKREALRRGDKALAAHVGRGKDIMSILLKANMSASEEDKLGDHEILGQMSTLMFAGMDTTSNALSRILHLMCLHPDAQERLRKEIQEALDEHGQLDYDALTSLPYLDAVCRETMRLYPPVPMLTRQTKKDAMLPLSKPIRGTDGKEHSEILVPVGTRIFVSVIGSNRNPDLWGPDAYEWKPERWMSPLPDVLVNAKIPGVYSHLMTFLGGSRACIGFKFSQLEMKVVLVELISKFKFELGEQKNIYWQMGGIATPIIDENSSLEPQLPLKVTSLPSI